MKPGNRLVYNNNNNFIFRPEPVDKKNSIQVQHGKIIYIHLLYVRTYVHTYTLPSVPWSIRPLTTHDVFIFKVRFLATSHMVLGDVSPVFSIT